MSEPEPGAPAAITISGEFGEQTQFTATAELSEALDLTGLINLEIAEKFQYSFRGLFLALVYSQHSISNWLREYIEESNVDVRGMLAAKSLGGSSAKIERLSSQVVGTRKTRASDPHGLYPNGLRTATASAFSWLSKAKGLSFAQKHEWVGLRHVFGALIFDLEFHEEDLSAWGFRRPAWASAFLGYVAEALPDDLDFWAGIDRQVFGAARASASAPDNHAETSERQPPAFLLTWDPKRFAFSRFQSKARLLESQAEIALEWSTGSLQTAPVGARVFLVREGQDSPGLVGFGRVSGAIRQQPHWDPKEREQGRVSFVAPITWQVLREQPVLSQAVLSHEFPDDTLLRSPSAGAQIPAPLAARLEAMCQGARVGPTIPGSPVVSAFDPVTALSESLPSIANDGVDGQSLIDIKADVQAIARVMCMKEVKPPLSIALFGNWGSGKSFFMRQLQNMVVKTMSLDSNQFYEDIIQVEFNAWHYVEANLWASLVFHLFENLRASTRASAPIAEQQHNVLLAQLGVVGQARLRAEQKLEQARADERSCQQTVLIRQNEAQDKQLALQRVSTVDVLKRTLVTPTIVSNLTQATSILGLSQTVGSAREVARSLSEIHQTASRASRFWRAFWNAPGRGKRMLFVALALLGPAIASLAISLVTRFAGSGEWDTLSKSLAKVGALLLPALQPIFGTRKEVDHALSALDRANDEFNDTIRGQQQELDRETAQAAAEHERAAKAVAAAQQALADADRAVADAKKALVEASPVHLLNSFIEERSASDDYRKNLGTLALVRRDFQKLSDLMGSARDHRAGKKRLSPQEIELVESLPRIDRIILYIDDLDRCPPKQVVEVLQAIHLLLAFDLFVVVVGVDPRWISLSLQKHYPELLGSDGSEAGDPEHEVRRARALDYLEKIFQIPFWINPIGVPELKAMVEGLLVASVATPRAQPEVASEARRADALAPTSNLGASVGEKAVPGTPSGSEPLHRSEAGDSSSAVVHEAKAAEDAGVGLVGTTLSRDEVRFIASLEHAVGTTPRSVKRFLNVYRLLRARVSQARAGEFEGEAGRPREFEAVLHLLAMFNTAPRIARLFCGELELAKAAREPPLNGSHSTMSSAQPTPVTLRYILTRVRRAGLKAGPESRLFDLIEAYVQQFAGAEAPGIEAYCRWYAVVSRYCFSGDSPRGLHSLPAGDMGETLNADRA